MILVGLLSAVFSPSGHHESTKGTSAEAKARGEQRKSLSKRNTLSQQCRLWVQRNFYSLWANPTGSFCHKSEAQALPFMTKPFTLLGNIQKPHCHGLSILLVQTQLSLSPERGVYLPASSRTDHHRLLSRWESCRLPEAASPPTRAPEVHACQLKNPKKTTTTKLPEHPKRYPKIRKATGRPSNPFRHSTKLKASRLASWASHTSRPGLKPTAAKKQKSLGHVFSYH